MKVALVLFILFLALPASAQELEQCKAVISLDALQPLLSKDNGVSQSYLKSVMAYDALRQNRQDPGMAKPHDADKVIALRKQQLKSLLPNVAANDPQRLQVLDCLYLQKFSASLSVTAVEIIARTAPDHINTLRQMAGSNDYTARSMIDAEVAAVRVNPY